MPPRASPSPCATATPCAHSPAWTKDGWAMPMSGDTSTSTATCCVLSNSQVDVGPALAVLVAFPPADVVRAGAGQRSAIAEHYDIDSEFFLEFLDPKRPATPKASSDAGRKAGDGDVAQIRLLLRDARLKPGDRMLEIGPGWGAWFEYAARRGVNCTGITISQTSKDYLDAKPRGWGCNGMCIWRPPHLQRGEGTTPSSSWG